MIMANTTPTSALRYQEAIGRQVAAQAAHHVVEQARGYSRVKGPVFVTVDDITAALSDVAGILRSSTFPQSLIDLCKEQP
jgi:hypothetical protein